MSRQYYYLVAGLPDILFEDKKIPLSTTEFKEYLKEHLNKKEMDIINLFFWQFDNKNILESLKSSDFKFDQRGNLNSEEISELFAAVKEGSLDLASKIAPAYLGVFIDAYKNEKAIFEGKSWDLQLSELYYQYVTNIKNPFIKEWFEFERDLNNILTALNCRSHEINISNQLVGKNDLVEKLTKSGAKDFGITDEIEFIDRILKISEDTEILNQEKGIDLLKWEILDEKSFFHYFTIEKLFVFLIQLSIAERWISLDKETGTQLFEKILNNLETSYEFPEEFSLK